MASTELDITMDRAKLKVLADSANSIFLTSILFSLRFRWSTEIATAATDGIHLLVNPHYWEYLSGEERKFLLCHEAWHVALDHVTRRGDRDPVLWNMAGDYLINYMLIKQRMKMPLGGLYDPAFDDSWTTDGIYKVLVKDPPPQSQSFICDIQNPSETGDGEGQALSEEEAYEAVQDIIVKAATRAKLGGEDIGNLPAEIRRYLDELLNPRLPWNRILQNHMHAIAKDDYSWRKPNRRFFPKHYLPSLYSPGLGKVAICFDMSGSVLDEQAQQFLSETYNIVMQLQPDEVTVLCWDTEIYNPQTIRTKQELDKYEFGGGGGTYFEPVAQYLLKHKHDVAIVFTDGYFNTDVTNPQIPIVWAIHSNHDYENWEAPFGKKIQFPID